MEFGQKDGKIFVDARSFNYGQKRDFTIGWDKAGGVLSPFAWPWAFGSPLIEISSAELTPVQMGEEHAGQKGNSTFADLTDREVRVAYGKIDSYPNNAFRSAIRREMTERGLLLQIDFDGIKNIPFGTVFNIVAKWWWAAFLMSLLVALPIVIVWAIIAANTASAPPAPPPRYW